MNFKKQLTWAALSLLALTAIGCSNVASTPDRTASHGMTRVAAVQMEAPLLYQRGQELVGSETEIVKLAMGKLNAAREAEGSRPLEILYIKREYADLLPLVESAEVEFAAGAIGISDEWAQRVAFTDSYYTAQLAVVMNPGYKRFAADKLSGLTIGVRQGTAVESWARSSYQDVEIVPFASLDEALLSLRRGEVEGVIDDLQMAAYALDTGVGLAHLEILPGSLGTFDVAMAVPKDNKILLNALNQAIADLGGSSGFSQLTSEHIGDRVASVRQRYHVRVEKERLATAPRRLLLRVSKDQGSDFDIYKVANLRFQLRNNKSGKSFRTSPVQFNKKIGVTSASIPPGSYTLYLPKFGNAPLGEVLIKSDDGKQVNYRLRWKANQTISLLAG
ncbi:MAG: ABC transporter substrate-binding protein [Acidobacteriota bacterium]